MFVVFPVALWIFSLIADIVYMSNGNADWANVAYYCVIGGIVGALVAAIFGFVDWTSLPNGSRAKRIGTTHMILNLIIVGLFVVNFYFRNQLDEGVSYATPFALSVIGIVMLLVSGWLGGELVYVHGVGVEGKTAPDYDPNEGKRKERVTTGVGPNIR
jgi:uncharacterized membrane protein